MNIEQVKKLKPIDRLLYWIKERESIRLKKEAGEPKPWTQDEILQRFRFTNVRRIDDKVSQWLLHNWYEPYQDHPSMLIACTIARQLNNPDALEAIDFPFEWEPDRVQEQLEERARQGLRNYSAAYMITGRYGYGKNGRPAQTKPYQTVRIVCESIRGFQIEDLETETMEGCWNQLVGRPGFASFITGQVVADLRWALSGKWADRNDWCPIGPGSQRGLNRLLQRDKDIVWKPDDFYREFNKVTPIMREVAPAGTEGIDLQGCFCEFDKYERVLWGEGRPKVHYQGI